MWKISTKNIIFSLFLCAGFGTFSCKKKPPIPADVFLTKGIKYAKQKKYDSCVSQLAKIDELHPYSAESKTGMPVLIYCHYMNRDYETIYPMIESFESLYPNSDQLSYLYYIKALSYFRMIKNYRRSMEVILNLENTIFALYERDSQSKYAENLLHLLPFVAEMKLQNKIYTAQYYVSQQDYIAATGRYTEILSQDLEEKQREELEKSFSSVMKNMGVKLEN
jgi:outer membrane protein assembly factor BamD